SSDNDYQHHQCEHQNGASLHQMRINIINGRGGIESLQPLSFRTASLIGFFYPRKMKLKLEGLWLERRADPDAEPSQPPGRNWRAIRVNVL
ncbi:hypothetical protein, partial [Yersinia enterocolitica]|uniref:hypothetical protein n=1 Tax=Yersinia enterocolitica TaxID=630 RepID=UPI001C8DB6E3